MERLASSNIPQTRPSLALLLFLILLLILLIILHLHRFARVAARGVTKERQQMGDTYVAPLYLLILIQLFGKKTRKPVQGRDADKDDDKEED